MDFTGRTLMERLQRPSRPDAGQGPRSPADDVIDDHVDELAQTESCAGPGPSQTVPAGGPDKPDESDSESMFRLGDLEIESTAKSPRKKSDHTGRWLRPDDGPWDPNPWLQYFLVACYLIIVLIVLAGFVLLNARGSGPSSSAAESGDVKGQELIWGRRKGSGIDLKSVTDPFHSTPVRLRVRPRITDERQGWAPIRWRHQ
jgi:hypothetical protein